jgi:hypothetical protein
MLPAWIGGSAMPSVTICGRQLPYSFAYDVPPEERAWVDEALPRMADGLAALAGDPEWGPELTRTFSELREICFTKWGNRYRQMDLTRSYLDEDTRAFNWDVDEVYRRDALALSTYLFHDAFHAVQLSRDGPTTVGNRREREVEATRRQIALMRRLGCDDRFVTQLLAFVGDPDAIDRRYREGVDAEDDDDDAARPVRLARACARGRCEGASG